MKEIYIKVVANSTLPLPAYQTTDAAGMDLYAHLPEAVVLPPMHRKLIPTGLHIELPQGTEAQVRPRSGLALKKGITVLNAPGTIDADFRGEVKVLLVNLSGQVQTIEPGERIAQMVIAHYLRAQWQPTDRLNNTSRGEGGYGSTGNN